MPARSRPRRARTENRCPVRSGRTRWSRTASAPAAKPRTGCRPGPDRRLPFALTPCHRVPQGSYVTRTPKGHRWFTCRLNCTWRASYDCFAPDTRGSTRPMPGPAEISLLSVKFAIRETRSGPREARADSRASMASAARSMCSSSSFRSVSGKITKHEVRHPSGQAAGRPRIAPEVIPISEGLRDRPQAVVTIVTTAQFQPDGAVRDVELVVHHDDLLDRHLVEVTQAGDRPAGLVHVRPRLGKHHARAARPARRPSTTGPARWD